MVGNPQVKDRKEKIIPTWRWFLSQNGIPALVGIFALLTSVIFNIIQLIHSSNDQGRIFEPAGSFHSGELIDRIIDQCKFSDSGTIPPLRILSDFADYGAFSHPE